MTGVPMPAEVLPFGFATRALVQKMHRIEQVMDCEDEGRSLAFWACGNSCWLYEMADDALADLDAHPLCERCFPDLATGPLAAPVVYFAERDGLIKIGCSRRVHKRVADLGATLLATIDGDGRTEAALHLAFAADRETGEWFRPSPSLLALIAHLEPAEIAA